MPQSPFKLLEPYSAKDKNAFFGRDAEIFALYNLLQQTRLVLVYGASGTGKTSLIHAGLPKVFKLTDWFRLTIRRRDNINLSLRSELAKHIDNNTPTIDLPQTINAVFESRWIPIYLVFDQFEEIFTLGNAEERRQFFTDLQTILNQNLPCKIILSMREEYIGHLYEYEPLVPTLFEHRFRVEPMKDETVRSVVTSMCDNYDIVLENRTVTVQQILEQVKEGKQAAYLPYLQIYLHYLYEKADTLLGKPLFTEGVIREVGKLGNVLKRFINSKIEEAQQFFQAQKLIVPMDFAAKLLDEFATDEGTKRSRKADELAKVLNTEGGIIKQALGYFDEKAKLLRADEDDVERYEPVHDVVAKQIHELRSAEDKEFKAFTRQLQNDHDRWAAEGKPSTRLLAASDLAKVDIYRERLERREEYVQEWRNYADESRQEMGRKKRSEQRRLLIISGIAVVAVVASIFAFIANEQAQTAKKEALAQKDAANKAQKDAELQKDFAENNLKLYKATEFKTQISDAQTFMKSGDIKYAQYARDSAKLILNRYFEKNDNFIKDLNNLDNLISKFKKK